MYEPISVISSQLTSTLFKVQITLVFADQVIIPCSSYKEVNLFL